MKCDEKYISSKGIINDSMFIMENLSSNISDVNIMSPIYIHYKSRIIFNIMLVGYNPCVKIKGNIVFYYIDVIEIPRFPSKKKILLFHPKHWFSSTK